MILNRIFKKNKTETTNVSESQFDVIYKDFPEFEKETVEEFTMYIMTTNYKLSGTFFSDMKSELTNGMCKIGGRFELDNFVDRIGQLLDYEENYDSMYSEFMKEINNDLQVVIQSEKLTYYGKMAFVKYSIIDQSDLNLLFVSDLDIEDIDKNVEQPEFEYDKFFVDRYIKENGGENNSKQKLSTNGTDATYNLLDR